MKKEKKTGCYTISIVAKLVEMHPQTLRLYEREGLLKPERQHGKNRLYSDEDIEILRMIKRLTHELGINLAGVEVILQMRQKMEEMHREFEEEIRQFEEEMKQLKEMFNEKL